MMRTADDPSKKKYTFPASVGQQLYNQIYNTGKWIDFSKVLCA